MVRPMRLFVGMMMIVAGFVTLAVVLAIVAFGGDGDEAPSSGDLLAGRTVTIVTPEDEATVEAGDIVITVDVAGFEIVDKLGEDSVEGEGHVIFYLDVDEMPTIPGQPAFTDDERAFHALASTSYTWKRLQAGVHVFGVQLVNNDDTPLEPPVLDDVEITVE